ncbi:MAG: OmpA family protein [Bacteroidia bacterium]
MKLSPFSFTKIFMSCFFILCFYFLKAQDEGFVDYQVTAKMLGTGSPAADAAVTIYADKKEIQKLKTDKNGKLKVELDYGPEYKIVFTKPGCVTSYMLLNSKVPEKKKVIIAGFGQDVIFIERMNTQNADTMRYKYPFTKWAYDINENKFKEDLGYVEEFKSGIFKEDVLAAKDKSAKDAKEKADKEAKAKALTDKKAADRKRREALRAEMKKKIKIAGKIVGSGVNFKPFSGTQIFLLNDKGIEVETSTANELGGFTFTKLIPGENFTIRAEGINKKTLAAGNKVTVANKENKEEGNFEAKEEKFVFRTLASDTKFLTEMRVADEDLKVDLQGKIFDADKNGKVVSSLKINYVDENGNILASAITDADGKFKFKGLAYDAVYLLNITVEGGQVKDGQRLFLTDEKGNVVKEITREDEKNFVFEIQPSDEKQIANIYYDDPWLVVFNNMVDKVNGVKEIVINEKVYFKSNDATLLPEAKDKLNQVIAVMENVPDLVIELGSHSDSKGSDEYNLALSERRAKSATDYIISQGISAKRITAKGYGETKLLNRCGNGVDCTEEEHAQNRRLEFRINRK